MATTPTNATMEIAKKPNDANATAAIAAMAKPVTGTPAPNSDIFFFINGAFRKEFEVCAQLNDAHMSVSFEADLVQKLNTAETNAYRTSLRVPKGCILRAQVHPVFRRFLVQSMWLQQQPAMLRYKGSEEKIDTKAPVCSCANPPCQKSAVRFVGNPGFFLQKSLLIDPFCIPVCGDTACVQQAQHMSSTIHAQAQKPPPQPAVNPALKAQMPNSVKSCNTCGSFEQAYGGTAVMLAACPLCGLAHYCSKQCQIQDWQRGHKNICTNAKGGAAAATAATKEAPKQKKQPESMPGESESKPDPQTASAPAPVPAPSPTPMPMPVQAAAPAPAPMSIKAPTSRKAPPVVAPTYQQTTELTQAMSFVQMPSYKMSELAPQVPAPSSMAVPTYKMPEPPAPPPRATSEFATLTYKMDAGAAQPKRDSVPTVLPTFVTPTFAAPSFVPPAAATEGATAAGPVPVKKGRKKAE